MGPFAIAAYGLGNFGLKSHRTLAAEFADQLTANVPSGMDDVAQRWATLIWTEFMANYASQRAQVQGLLAKAVRTDEEEHELKTLLQIAGGHFLGGRLASEISANIYMVNHDLFLSAPPIPVLVPPGSFVVQGCPSVFQKITFGFDEGGIDRVIDSKKWLGTREELTALVGGMQMYPMSILNIRDGIDLVYSTIYSTIKSLRFSPMAPVCGGPIEVAVITTDRPFRWAIHKNLSVAVTMALFNET